MNRMVTFSNSSANSSGLVSVFRVLEGANLEVDFRTGSKRTGSIVLILANEGGRLAS